MSLENSNLPHPQASGVVKVIIVIVKSLTDLPNGNKRVVVDIDNFNPIKNIKHVYNGATKVGVHISQEGRASALWMDDAMWRIVRRKDRTRRQGWKSTPIKTLSLDIEQVVVDEAHMKSLSKIIAKII